MAAIEMERARERPRAGRRGPTRLLLLMMICAVLGSLVSSRAALADDLDPRFRGGIGLQGGTVSAPDVVTVGVLGVRPELGLQVNDAWAFYAVPSVEVVLGEREGFDVTAALLAEYTLHDTLSMGLGPEAGRVGGGNLYGARMRLAWIPLVGVETKASMQVIDGTVVDYRLQRRRTGIAVALELRLLTGAGAFEEEMTESDARFVLSPMLTLGYQVF